MKKKVFAVLLALVCALALAAEAMPARSAATGPKESVFPLSLPQSTFPLEMRIEHTTVSFTNAGVVNSHGVAILKNGKADADGRNKDLECTVHEKEWSDLVSVKAGLRTSIGLRADGTVVGSGTNDHREMMVWGWTDIVDIAAGNDRTIGLKSDGTVVATGGDKYGETDVDGWTDVVAIYTRNGRTFGLKSDGTVYATGKDDYGETLVRGWTQIVALSNGEKFTVGLRADGTAVATGKNKKGQCDVEGWTDLVAVSAGMEHTLGLRSDGTVVAVGNNDYGQCNVQKWTEIVRVFAGANMSVGLRADGTVVMAGLCTGGDPTSWTDLADLGVGSDYVWGLTKTGEVIVTHTKKPFRVAISGVRLPGEDPDD